LVAKRWGREDPIGKRISFDSGAQWLQVIGVVGDVREFGPDRDAPFEAYLPMAQRPAPGALLARTAGDPGSVAGLLRQAVHYADPDNAITNFETLEQARANSIESPRSIARVFGLFAVLALLIAVGGITSMLVLLVRQRTREFGIRIALGAAPRNIVISVVRHGMAMVVAGLVCGLAGAYELTRFLTKLLFHVEPTDAPTYVLVSLLLLAAALIGCSVPAYRASRIEPQTALRCD
jgi:predicted lysophospholipase L1 biosynthesis ABC-type transport system permease subunit